MILHSRVVYTTYFGEMELSIIEKLRREIEAREFEYWMLLFFWLLEEDVSEHDDIEEIDREEYYETVYWRYRDWVEEWLLFVAANDETLKEKVSQAEIDKETANDELIRDHVSDYLKELDPQIRAKAKEIVDATFDHADDAYYTSEERASVIAANETNFIGNYRQLQVAKEQGRTLKKWVTMKDRKVRRTHELVDDKVIGIDEYFTVGRAKMLYPLDQSLGNHPEETVNCRCVVEYI